ncbi:MAG: ImmA/IrrE family metallo-endopeptidase [Alphaproteobacteria bacterium]|nr:ImmA/IrrE family metallo-endopeptidase [Alphaproteobacteria bacterium]MBU0803165.1 ImmA/IrrE family metallo-endopeptidase [Alphaproteobacteria bacterium]MBU0873853.1 ImmA/IrrE family metallo-endopeptidase [Alphaproteobacteria bacterium]MBU1400647.1 ImmA/IrrE family metallo-endopeptidase [Alphaproteobacteria bacterium]MBU1590520.1 ImmA/IrrE family metallo-endopeptidase [Alphaproteobacteria bacterium]
MQSAVADPFEVIARHQKAPPIPLDAISADLGLRVVQTPLGSDTAGQIVRDGRSHSGYSIYINSTQHPNRQRFTWAHEIAHFALHRDLIESGIVDDTMYRSSLSNFYEVQANKMAADILMPIRLVKRWRDLMQMDVVQLAKAFQVSTASMQIRLDGLKS